MIAQWLVFVLAFLCVSYGQQNQDYKEVNLVSQGIVRGTVEKAATIGRRNIISFKGIPYARPLNESSRFKPPEDPDRFKMNLDAFQSRPCLQISPFDSDQLIGSEDCLTLDVYAQDWYQQPGSGNARVFPVVVYFPGGEFRYGGSHTFGPNYLLDNDLVLVIVNYRLGALGFLSTEDGESPGNYGLMDQQKALAWVKTNINSFGGDKERITVFGHDSGAVSISLHLLNSKSNVLFKQAALSGGSVLNPWAFHHRDAWLHAKNLATRMDCATGSSRALVDCLRRKNPEDIVRETLKMKNITFLPVVDKNFGGREPFLEDDPIKLLLEKSARQIPLLLGMMKEEGSIQFFDHFPELSRENLHPVGALTRYFTPYLYPHTIFNSSLPIWTRHKLEAIAKGVMYVYFKNVQATDWANSKQNWIEAISDFQFRSGMEMLGRLVNHQNLSNTYMYQFESSEPLSFGQLVQNKNADPSEYGTAHMDDAFYYFNTAYDSRLQSQINPQNSAVISSLKHNFKEIMTQFATEGNFLRLTLRGMTGKWHGYGPNETVLRIRRDSGQSQNLRCETEGRFRTQQLDFFSSFVKDMLVDDSKAVYFEEQETNEHYKSATWGLLGLAIVLAMVCVVLAAIFIINKRNGSKEAKFKRLNTSPSTDGQEMRRV